MADEARLLGAFLVPLLAALAATPVAIAVAGRTQFQDKPVGYKGHGRPTPYLGGAAVFAAFAAGVLTLGGGSRLLPIVGCAFGLWVLGTVDDKVSVPPEFRVIAEVAAAAVLWVTGLGWGLVGEPLIDLPLTCLWVVALVNAFNLMDNMDGAAATIASVTGLGLGGLALSEGDIGLAVVGVGLAGACAGFLPYNLAKPSRIFLGDGGSIPIGFIVAAGIMALPESRPHWETLVVAILLTGLPLLDTSLVLVSRRRAGVSFLQGGRDHLTHRLLPRFASARRVAATLGLVQAVLATAAVATGAAGSGSVVTAGVLWFIAGVAAVAVLEGGAWAPERPPPISDDPAVADAVDVRADVRSAPSAPRVSVTAVEAVVLGILAFACCVSPFFFGFYDLSVWGPIALSLLAVTFGWLIARPAAPRREALVAVGALVGLWLFSLLSTAWAESADQAGLEANRWLLYAAFFGLVVLLLRTDRLSRMTLAIFGAGIGAVALYLLGFMVIGDGPDLFVSKRLFEPLGYVNGQASFLLLGIWPLVAVAERAASRAASAAAVGGTSVLVGLVLLTQTRAVLPAAVVALAVIFGFVPGRTRRLLVLLAVALGVAAAMPAILDVYSSAEGARPTGSAVRLAALAAVGGGVLSAGVWALAFTAVRRREAPWARLRLRGRTAWLAAGAAALVLVLGGLAVVGDPVDRARDEWSSFKHPTATTDPGSRFGSGSGNRYDYWRIAVNEFRDQPLGGAGAGNYDTDYYAQRQTQEYVKNPHSFVLQIAAELGLAGLLLVAVLLGAIGLGFARRVRASRLDPDQRALTVAAAGIFVTWLVHTSVDWLHLIPGLTCIALAAAAILVGPWDRVRAPTGPEQRWRLVRRGALVAAGVAVLFGSLMIGRSTLALHYRTEGYAKLASDPRESLERANDALALSDEALPSYYLKAAALARFNDYAGARRALLDAASREPHDYVTYELLGDLAVRRGLVGDAKKQYARASALNPRDEKLRARVADPAAALR